MLRLIKLCFFISWLLICFLSTLVSLIIFTKDGYSFRVIKEEKITDGQAILLNFKLEEGIEHLRQKEYIYTFYKKDWRLRLTKVLNKEYYLHRPY